MQQQPAVAVRVCTQQHSAHISGALKQEQREHDDDGDNKKKNGENLNIDLVRAKCCTVLKHKLRCVCCCSAKCACLLMCVIHVASISDSFRAFGNANTVHCVLACRRHRFYFAEYCVRVNVRLLAFTSNFICDVRTLYKRGAITIISYSKAHTTMTTITAIQCTVYVKRRCTHSAPQHLHNIGICANKKQNIMCNANLISWMRNIFSRRKLWLSKKKKKEKKCSRRFSVRWKVDWMMAEKMKIIFIRTWEVLLNVCDSMRTQEPIRESAEWYRLCKIGGLCVRRTTTVFIFSSTMPPPPLFQVQYLPFDIPLNYKMRIWRTRRESFS